MEDDPLILTLTLEPSAQTAFDALRTAHFPPERLHVSAHITLFHALPAAKAPGIIAAVHTEAGAIAAFPVTVADVRFLGRGVAFGLQSLALAALRERLRFRWTDSLTAQDRQPWRPHVTIQNKVEPPVAKALYQRLSADFARYTVEATGLALWHYRGGPWDVAATFPFRS